MIRRTNLLIRPLIILCLLAGSEFAIADDTSEIATEVGVLDTPLPPANNEQPVTTLEPDLTTTSNDQDVIDEALREEFAEEQEELEQLPRIELEELAEQGERGAQVNLAEDFAEEAALLSFAPAAANDALSDAVRWYAIAAQRGFPGAPALDQAGVQFYPIRVQRPQ